MVVLAKVGHRSCPCLQDALNECDPLLRFSRIPTGKNEPAVVSKLLVTELNKLRKRNPSICAEQTLETCGCESTGEAIRMFVVRSNPDLSEDDVRNFMREGLTGYKVPKSVVFKDELPKTVVGKILRRELRDVD